MIDLLGPETEEEKAGRRFLGFLLWLAAIVVFGVMVSYSRAAHAVKLDQQECARFAVWSSDVVWARDVGADKNKVREFLQQNKREHPYFELILRYLDKLWGLTEDREDIVRALFMDCVRRGGDYGQDT